MPRFIDSLVRDVPWTPTPLRLGSKMAHGARNLGTNMYRAAGSGGSMLLKGASKMPSGISAMLERDPITYGFKHPRLTIAAGAAFGVAAVGRALQRKRYEAPIAVQQAIPRAGMANRYYQLQAMQGPGLKFTTRRRRGPIRF